MSPLPMFGWLHIARLGLVQACMGAVVVVTTSTLNRIMVVELALPAILPGFWSAFITLFKWCALVWALALIKAGVARLG